MKFRRKVDEWIASIEDEALREQVKPVVIVTGGCIASMLLNEPVNDYDLYFTDFPVVASLAKYYFARFKENPPPRFKDRPVEMELKTDGGRVQFEIKSAGIASTESAGAEYQYFEQTDPDATDAREYLEKVTAIAEDHEKAKPYQPILITPNAITLSGNVQLVLRFWGTAGKIHENFDFVHCTNWWASSDGKLRLKKGAMEALLARSLVYQGSKYPLCSLLRMRKFIKRGWTIHAGQVLKIALQVAELNWNNPTVMQEQLTGVDFAYFQEVLDKLKAHDPERMDRAYLSELLDILV